MDDYWQGLGPIHEALKAAGLNSKIEQVGGGTLAVNVYLTARPGDFVAVMVGDDGINWAAHYYASDDADGKELGYTLTTAQLITQVQRLNNEEKA